jgi:predicted DNA-binding transcriptional regulator AlpA
LLLMEHRDEQVEPERRANRNRRDGERRNGGPPIVAQQEIARKERRFGDASVAALEPIRKLTLAVEALAHQLTGESGSNAPKPTCTVEEAAALLGTTAKGIYALHERGKLPKSIGPGRRLVFLREELLQLARRALSSGGHGR